MKVQILRTHVALLDYCAAVAMALDWVQRGKSCYICAANVHMLMEAYDSAEFRKVVNQADMVTPDGMPLVWMMRFKGFRSQQRVYGPTLMLHVLEATAKENIPVGFYGGTPQVLDQLIGRMQTRYEGLNVVFSLSPPFRELSPEEDARVIEQINGSGARILFVGLGCPRQEMWMAAHRNKLQVVISGVGAAFDFHAGVKSQAPEWMQKIGLEWLFRLLSEPARLWKRYLYHNPRFVVLAFADLFGILK